MHFPVFDWSKFLSFPNKTKTVDAPSSTALLAVKHATKVQQVADNLAHSRKNKTKKIIISWLWEFSFLKANMNISSRNFIIRFFFFYFYFFIIIIIFFVSSRIMHSVILCFHSWLDETKNK